MNGMTINHIVSIDHGSYENIIYAILETLFITMKNSFLGCYRE